MSLKIDPKSHVPIYQQIVEGLRAAVASGLFRPGEPLPSLRALAVELLVNPNTVQRAYEALEREGVVESRRGLGMFVTRRGRHSARGQAEDAIQATLSAGIRAGLAADLTPEAIECLFKEALRQATRQTEVKR